MSQADDEWSRGSYVTLGSPNFISLRVILSVIYKGRGCTVEKPLLILYLYYPEARGDSNVVHIYSVTHILTYIHSYI